MFKLSLNVSVSPIKIKLGLKKRNPSPTRGLKMIAQVYLNIELGRATCPSHTLSFRRIKKGSLLLIFVG